MKELEQLQQFLESKDNQTSENEYSSEIPLPEIGNPEMEIDAKYEDIQDFSMDEDPASDAENYQDKLSDENNLEVFQEKVKIPETNLDLLASRFYEFIGNKDEIAKEKNGSKKSKHANGNERKVIMENECKEPSLKDSIKDRKYECSFCGKCFDYSNNRTRHERIHTGEKPFQCNTCCKRFALKITLEIHERIHTGDKPFQCKRCKKCFRDSSKLKLHERVHTGERPFQCKDCNKSFKTSADRIRHEKIHYREKPFICKICQKSYSRLSYLRVHERIHDRIKKYQ